MSGGESSSESARTEAVQALELRRLTGSCSRAAFSCGEPDIDKWFRNKAQDDHDRMKCRVMTGHLNRNAAPIGFYSAFIKMELASDLPQENRPLLSWPGGRYPALHLQYLGVIRPMQRRGFGTVLMGALVDDFYEVAIRSGIVALTVVAINARTADFYRKMGFVDFGEKGSSTPSLFLPAASVIDAREKLAD
jgi:GNAT superfamily N-acetyltransferase